MNVYEYAQLEHGHNMNQEWDDDIYTEWAKQIYDNNEQTQEQIDCTVSYRFTRRWEVDPTSNKDKIPKSAWTEPRILDRALSILHSTHTDSEINWMDVMLPRRTKQTDGLTEPLGAVVEAGMISYYVASELIEHISDKGIRQQLRGEFHNNFDKDGFWRFKGSIEDREDCGDSFLSQYPGMEEIATKNDIPYVYSLSPDTGFDGDYSVPEDDEVFYNLRSNCIADAVKDAEYAIEDLQGEFIDRSGQSSLMRYPAAIVRDEFDIELDEPIICSDSMWTTPSMDYWDCSFALLAVQQDLVDIDQVKPYQQPRNMKEVLEGTDQKPWLSALSDEDVLDLAVQVGKVDEYGNPPYRALMAIGRLHGLEFKDDDNGGEYLTFEARNEAEDIFDEMAERS